jgi:hypothetical protein
MKNDDRNDEAKEKKREEEEKKKKKKKKRIGLADNISFRLAFSRVARQGRVWMHMASHRVLCLGILSSK